MPPYTYENKAGGRRHIQQDSTGSAEGVIPMLYIQVFCIDTEKTHA
jgi:hypothetical protein